jgi:hypothetical protein
MSDTQLAVITHEHVPYHARAQRMHILLNYIYMLWCSYTERQVAIGIIV